MIGLFTGPLMMITKEVRYLQMYVIQFWMIVTPIVFDIDHIPHKYRTIVEYNPLSGADRDGPVRLPEHVAAVRRPR